MSYVIPTLNTLTVYSNYNSRQTSAPVKCKYFLELPASSPAEPCTGFGEYPTGNQTNIAV